jgi:MFS family permease
MCLLLLVHSAGKRFLSLCCTSLCFVACLLLGLYAFLVPGVPEPAVQWLPLALFIFLSFAQSIVSQMPWTLLCEVFPFRTRGLASGITAAACYVFLFLASKTYLDIEHGLQLHGAFWFYSGISFLGFLFLYFRLVETEGKTLEEIEHHFTRGLSARGSK